MSIMDVLDFPSRGTVHRRVCVKAVVIEGNARRRRERERGEKKGSSSLSLRVNHLCENASERGCVCVCVCRVQTTLLNPFERNFNARS